MDGARIENMPDADRYGCAAEDCIIKNAAGGSRSASFRFIGMRQTGWLQCGIIKNIFENARRLRLRYLAGDKK